jgi:hypothetical protein
VGGWRLEAGDGPLARFASQDRRVLSGIAALAVAVPDVPERPVSFVMTECQLNEPRTRGTAMAFALRSRLIESPAANLTESSAANIDDAANVGV